MKKLFCKPEPADRLKYKNPGRTKHETHLAERDTRDRCFKKTFSNCCGRLLRTLKMKIVNAVWADMF